MLDTNTCIYAMKRTPGFNARLPLHDCGISIIVLYEFLTDEGLILDHIRAMTCDNALAGANEGRALPALSGRRDP